MNYEEISSDVFLECCKRRSRQLINSVPRGDDSQVDIYEFRTGSIHSRSVTWKDGRATERVSVSQVFKAITREDFEIRQLGDGDEDRHAFKDGRGGVMSILDVYDAITNLGKYAPNTVDEWSIFSHAYLEGPILVNSYDDRRVRVPDALRLSAEGGRYRNIEGSLRDPDDKDCRSALDFIPPTMTLTRAESMRSAFSKSGKIWIWGCNFDRKANVVLSLVRRKVAEQSDVGDETSLTFKNLNREQLSSFAEFNSRFKLDVDKLFQTRSCTVSFGAVRQAMWDRICASYTFQAAQALKIPVIGAIFGTYASFDRGHSGLMSVSADTAINVSFYKKFFGMRTDEEGRNYGVFSHGMRMS